MNNKTNILIVEDENIVAADMEIRLQMLGYSVLGIAVSSAETLTFIEKEKPDLILMDIKLKGKINGIQTAAIIKEKYDIPVVYVTAFADQDNLVRIKETEPFGIISKPFDDKELINVIETAFHKYKIEQRLKESKENLRTTLNSISDAVISTDNESNIIGMNPMAESLTGWEFSQAEGKPLAEVFNIVDMKTRKKCKNPVDKVLKHGKTVNLSNQTLLISRNGSEYPIADSGSPILDDNGLIKGVVLVFRDVTEEYKMQRELYENQERLSAVYDSSPTVIIVSTINEGRIIEVNNAFTRFTGWEAEEAIGKTSLKLGLWAEPAESQRQKLIENLKKNGFVRNQEFIFQDSKGNEITGLLSADIIQIGGENYTLVNVVNISERKKIEKEKDKYLCELKFITDTIIKINTVGDINVMCKFLGETIHSVNKKSYIMVLLNDPSANKLRIRALVGFDEIKDDFLKKIEKNITSALLNPDQLTQKNSALFTIGKIKYVSKSLCSLLGKDVNKNFCRKTEKILRVNKVYTAGFSQDDLLMGGVIILTPEDYNIQYQSAIETVITHFSVLIYRRQVEKILRKRKERYQNFIEQSFEGIYRQELENPVDTSLPEETQIDLIYDNAFIAESNQAMVEMYQLHSVDDLIGQRMIDLHGGRNNPVNRAAVRKFIQSDYRIIDEETMETLGDGSIVYFSNNTIGIIEKGYLVRMWGTQLDITERKKIQDQIKKELKEKNILLKEIHHRVKNNLQIICSLIDMQLAKEKSKVFQNCAGELSDRIFTMAMIHEQLYSAESLTEINIESYINDIVFRIVQSYAHTNVSIKKEIKNFSLSLDMSIPLGLMINELLSNAVKHAFPEKRSGIVTIKLSKKQDCCELRIIDNGIGMPTDINFADPSTLGLKLVHILAGQLNGSVKIYHKKGTSIKITFPLHSMKDLTHK